MNGRTPTRRMLAHARTVGLKLRKKVDVLIWYVKFASTSGAGSVKRISLFIQRNAQTIIYILKSSTFKVDRTSTWMENSTTLTVAGLWWRVRQATPSSTLWLFYSSSWWLSLASQSSTFSSPRSIPSPSSSSVCEYVWPTWGSVSVWSPSSFSSSSRST